MPGLSEPLTATGASAPGEDGELDVALRGFTDPGRAKLDYPERAQPLLDFLAKYPASPWAMALQTNLGMGYYNAGYFSRALSAWQAAWALGKDGARTLESKRLTDRAVGELARMHARLGHADELEALFADVGSRPISGAATEYIAGAKEGLWAFRNDWGVAYLCGPKALGNVLKVLRATPQQIKVTDDARSGQHGFSLTQVSELAAKAAQGHKLIYRAPGGAIPVPSVINWKLHHYAAIVAERDGKYLIKDPTFASGDRMLTAAALDAEGSGYYLVPNGAQAIQPPLAEGQTAPPWRDVASGSDEANAVYGMGFVTNHDPLLTKGNDATAHGTCPLGDSQSNSIDGGGGSISMPNNAALIGTSSHKGMCGVNAHMEAVNLTLNDRPLGYGASKGPSVVVSLTYNQREATQPATFGYFNFSQKWNFSFQDMIVDDPTYAGYAVVRYPGGGGGIAEIGLGSGLSYFESEPQGGGQLEGSPTSGDPTSYTLTLPDGSKRVYGLSDGATSYPRRWFLTQIIDTQGLTATLAYDTSFRLTTITDAASKVTTLSYLHGTNPLLVTKVTDPFGRYTTLAYDGSQRLSSITDPVGIVSSFHYDSSDLIDTLSTPYGAHSFAWGDGSDYQRWLTITDPLSYTERIEFKHNASGIANEDSSVVPTGSPTWNDGLEFRNTFHWNKHVYATVGTSAYTDATIIHWPHDQLAGGTTANGWPESIKRPLENRVWYAYPDYLTYASKGGTYGEPTDAARVLDDSSTQASHATYNSSHYAGDAPGDILLGQLLSQTDPLGRTLKYTYATNKIDLTRVERQISSTPTWATLAQYVYDSNHNVTQYTDAAGKVWKYAYNTAGQLIYATNPLNETRFWEYDSSGRLTRATVPYAVAFASVTYGTTNSSAATAMSYNYTSSCSGMTAPANTNLPISVTDSEGRVLCYEYDALDRVTKVKYPDNSTELYDYGFPSGLSSLPSWTTGSVPTAGDPSLDLWTYTDRLGRETSYTYDRNRRLRSMTEPVKVGSSTTTRTTQYEYYEDGALKNLIDANGVVTHWAIDLQSRPVSKTYAYGTGSAKTETYAYESTTSRLKTVTDALGQVKTYAYNNDDSVSSISYTHPSGLPDTADVSFTYDAWYPRLATMTDMSGLNGTTGAPASATTTFAYAAVGGAGALRLEEEDHDGYYNQHAGYYYDDAGRLTERWAAESQEGFGYDTLGRVNSYVTDLGTFSYTYLGQTGQAASQSVTVSGNTSSIAYGYDTNANDRKLLTITPNSTAVRGYTLSYAANAAVSGAKNPYTIAGITEAATSHPLGAQSWAYTYDNSDRLLSAVATAVSGSGATSYGTYGWELDKLDNPTKMSYPEYGGYDDYPTTNALNQQTQNAWWQNFGYDDAGNLTREADENDATLRSYTYDMEGRLLTMTDPAVSGGYTIRYFYDGFGRRILQQATVSGVKTYKRYLWCGMTLCQQRDVSTGSVRRYLMTGEYVNSGTKKYGYVRDQVGSVRDLIDLSTGARVGALDYKPYGQVKASNGVMPDYQYAGMMWIDQVGLNASATRFYDGSPARWMTRDWIREAGGINMYGYVGGNPIMGVDPLGMDTDPACVARYIAGGAACGMVVGAGGALTTGGLLLPAIGIVGEIGAYAGGAAGVAMCQTPDKNEGVNDSTPPISTPVDAREKRKDYCEALYESIVKDCQAERNAKKRRECYAAASITRARCLQGGD